MNADFNLEQAIVEKLGEKTVIRCQHGRIEIPERDVKVGDKIIVRYRIKHVTDRLVIVTHAPRES